MLVRPSLESMASQAPAVVVALGYQLRRSSGDALAHGVPFLVKLPFAPWIELQVGSNGYTVSDTARYFDDLVAGAKLHLADQTASRPSLAVTASVSVPTVAQRGYVRTYDL